MPSAARILTIYTRTPLHVGAGADVGAIDQPIVRERHTGLPVIPGSSIKGVLADLWHADTVTDEPEKGKPKTSRKPEADITWLFGSDDAREDRASAGALLFGEARILAFPIRSARGSFGWITSPLILARAARDRVAGFAPLSEELLAKLSDTTALFAANTVDAPLAIPAANGEPQPRVVLEDYTFTHAGTPPVGLESALVALFPDDAFRSLLAKRLVVVSDGMMSHFARTACEVAQHVRINDATGTADEGGLFNQENIPADTLFYSTVHATRGRSAAHRTEKYTSEAALDALARRLGAADTAHTIQIGADATTGLGFCSVKLEKPSTAA
jgi:CRISPR-associated protein Cmr4